MATIKSYTDLQQSKKLAEILPLESADMVYYYNKSNNTPISQYPFIRTFKEKDTFSYLHCWSLAALLSVLSLPDLIQDKADGELFWQCSVYNEDGTLLCETYDNNPIDACVAMIERLHELNLL